MMKSVVGIISVILSQVFVGLVLGLLWNYSLVPLGAVSLPMSGACALWGLIVIATIMLCYVGANVVMSVVEYYRRLIIAEMVVKLPSPADKKADEE